MLFLIPILLPDKTCQPGIRREIEDRGPKDRHPSSVSGPARVLHCQADLPSQSDGRNLFPISRFLIPAPHSFSASTAQGWLPEPPDRRLRSRSQSALKTAVQTKSARAVELRPADPPPIIPEFCPAIDGAKNVDQFPHQQTQHHAPMPINPMPLIRLKDAEPGSLPRLPSSINHYAPNAMVIVAIPMAATS